MHSRAERGNAWIDITRSAGTGIYGGGKAAREDTRAPGGTHVRAERGNAWLKKEFFMIRSLFISSLLFPAACGLCAYAGAENTSMAIGSAPQLFVDDFLIAEHEGVIRRSHACEKLPAPVLEPEKPWERDGDDQRVYIYGTVLRDEESGLLRMWYNRGSDVLYATSRNGVDWTRPALGLIEINGAKANNCILRGIHSPSVVFNPDAPVGERYAMLGYSRKDGRGYHILHSPDGLSWKPFPGNPVLEAGDTCTLMYAPEADGYFAFHKRNVQWRGHERRTVYLSVSPDSKNWPAPKLVMAPDAADDAQTGKEGGRFSQFYNMAAVPYADLYLGFVTHFRYSGAPSRKGPLQSPHDGPIDTQLVHSRDGRTWHRAEDRSPVIPNGPYDYDAGCILGVANSLIDLGNEVWTWYTAITTTHGGFVPEKRITIALAKWRRDGFVSLDTGEKPGRVRTVLLQSEGRRLAVNAETRGLTAAVLDAGGTPLPGYDHDSCGLLKGDSVDHPVSWRDRERLPADMPFRLEFRMKDTRLYSFSIR
jgi:hypothetical protein